MITLTLLLMYATSIIKQYYVQQIFCLVIQIYIYHLDRILWIFHISSVRDVNNVNWDYEKTVCYINKIEQRYS